MRRGRAADDAARHLCRRAQLPGARRWLRGDRVAGAALGSAIDALNPIQSHENQNDPARLASEIMNLALLYAISLLPMMK